MGFQPAKRHGVYARIAVSGPTGSGKSFTSLRLATGLVEGGGGKIAAADSENNRLLHYADKFNFSHMPLHPPFQARKYMDAIDLAVKEGFQAIILDSLSHEWLWLSDEKLAKDEKGGNSYTNWKPFKKIQNTFMTHIQQAPIHIFGCYRSKTQYVLQANDKGKQVPVKAGMGIIGQNDDEYEYMLHLEMSPDGNVATVGKDDTTLFKVGSTFQPTEETGRQIYRWCNSADFPAANEQAAAQPDAKADRIKVTKKLLKAAERTEEAFLEYATRTVGRPITSFADLEIKELDELSATLKGKK